jgi:outer membrane protein assembly factor BamB
MAGGVWDQNDNVRHNLLLTLILMVSVGLCAAQATPPRSPKNGEVVFTKCWAYPLGERPGTILAGDASAAFVGTEGGGVIAVSPSGGKLWATDLGGEITSNIETAGDLLFVVTSAAGKTPASTLRGVSRATGVARWSMNVAASSRQWIFTRPNTVFVISSDGTASSFEADSGKIRWSSLLHGPVAAASSDLSRVLAATDRKILAVDNTGRLEEIPTDGIIAGYIAAASAKDILIGDSRGAITLFGGRAKPLWRYRTGGAISNIIPGDDTIIVASHDNFVYSISAYRGSVVWKRRFPGRAAFLRSIDDNLLLVGMADGGDLVAVDAGHGRLAGQIAVGEGEHIAGISQAENGLFTILSDQTLYGYSTKGCP